MFTIEMLLADEGDALWIEYGSDPVRRLLIDCGRKTAYRAIAERLEQMDSPLELFVLTHVDADHITGAVPLLQDARFGPEKVKDVWFNGWRHLKGLHWRPEEDAPGILGAQQGEFFGALLRDRGYHWNEFFAGMPVAIPDEGPLPRISLDGGLVLTILGPTTEQLRAMLRRWEDDLAEVDPEKRIDPGDYERALEVLGQDKRSAPDVLGGGHEGPIVISDLLEVPFDPDDSEPNGSSISFLAEYEGVAVLFAADAHSPQVEASVRRLLRERQQEKLSLTALKLAHHGSARNSSSDLLKLLNCSRYLISTNGTRHHHPDPATLARVLDVTGGGVEFYFNYASDETRLWDDDQLKSENRYETFYAEDDEGLKVSF